ncbi:putative ubiquitin thioesterase [Wickerhamomyces ciferrii]|uniref:Ubiquitin thioesterase OTU n=1 Tax=Wickerhamomyces ciferrii (strain ATCC 14091 / BCRC 22168 / CBS 111 / JCM 3599 / NBRC 0793 / NRRL Y-1031 F-60-10) TaxID=1206466 RepID=K0KM43_WICCF|nr:putative ubiquitin thioesterase [Wickerhamomyces ciferrii]CCH42449.1 putative ubiquitin thioesterase [Wickerhamomyces ciferrii]
MRLKVVNKSIQKIISIQDDSQVSQLLKLLETDGIISHSNNLIIKSGFPPKPINLSNLQEQILDLGIRPGDKLIIEENGTNGQVQQATSTSTKQKIELTKPSQDISTSQTSLKIPNTKGSIHLHKIDDDNSCLFNSIAYLTQSSINLREIIQQYILSNPETYNDAILGKPIQEYIKWILKPTSWGGAIELQILSTFFDITIHSIDVENNRIDSFNPDAQEFIVVLFTGIHYDCIIYKDNIKETRIFNKSNNEILQYSQKLSQGLNHKGYVTNTNTFQVKCKQCGLVLKGEKEINRHATIVKHFDFGEV